MTREKTTTQQTDKRNFLSSKDDDKRHTQKTKTLQGKKNTRN